MSQFNMLNKLNRNIHHWLDYNKIRFSAVEQNKINFDELFAEFLVENNIIHKYPTARFQFNLLKSERFYTDRKRLKTVLKHLLEHIFLRHDTAGPLPEITFSTNTQDIRMILTIAIHGCQINMDDILYPKNNLFKKALKGLKGKITSSSSVLRSETFITLWLPDLYALQNKVQFHKPAHEVLSKSNLYEFLSRNNN